MITQIPIICKIISRCATIQQSANAVVITATATREILSTLTVIVDDERGKNAKFIFRYLLALDLRFQSFTEA